MPEYVVIAGSGSDVVWECVEASCPAEAAEKIFPNTNEIIYVFGVRNSNRYQWEPRKLFRVENSIK